MVYLREISESITDVKYKQYEYDGGDTKELEVYSGIRKIGKVSIESIYDGPKEFDSYLTDEEYDDLIGDDEFAMINHIEVNPGYKNMGIGRTLMTKAIDICYTSGNHNIIMLNASPIGFTGLRLKELVAFYQSFGFTAIKYSQRNVLMILKIR